MELADLFLMVGSNAAWCHPITFPRIEKRKAAAPDELRVIVIVPRRIETADLGRP
jgi:ferredoxin-nitrate reductase